ncbi:MAG: CUAEP/CCAEP-tail radical SAM (seleno)protein, partial [Dehalococcoidia bacterium]
AAAERVKAVNPTAHLCFFGLYAPVNEGFLRRLGAKTILGGEFEPGLVALVTRLAAQPEGYEQDPVREPSIALQRQQFLVPDRHGLPALGRYAALILPDGERRTVGYTEASRGCKHRCRHCPIVPVYGGRFRIVSRDVVLEDIHHQVAAGARHISFGDPDFFNGIGHALPLVRALHDEFPDLTYDVTIKIEHLLRYAAHLTTLRDTGCLFVTSAVEAIEDPILEIFDKRHTRADFLRVLSLFREVGLALCPTFVTFTPWTSLEGYRALLALLAELGLIESLPPIQLTIRLLIPAGSLLIQRPDVQALATAFDETALRYRWAHPDPRVDHLYEDVLAAVQAGQASRKTRRAIFSRVWALAHRALNESVPPLPAPVLDAPHGPIPYVSEPWFC